MGLEALLSSQIIGLAETIDDEVASLLVAGTGITITYNDGAGTLTIAASGGSGIGGSTGATDNAVLRADGTGGATVENSAIVIPDSYTASPNNTVNHASIQATGGSTNVSISVMPKGTGAFVLQVPDGTSTGGNARGASAVDLGLVRTDATHVASGTESVCLGVSNTASGQRASALGGGSFNVASGDRSVTVGGQQNTASALGSVAIGLQSLSDRYYAFAHACGWFASGQPAQYVRFIVRNKTTNATATTLFLDGSSVRLTIPSGRVFMFSAMIVGVKSDGTAVASYLRKGCIKNVGGTTSLVGSIETIGTDIEDNASTDVAITADNTNDALQINVTGIASETWRWVAVVEGAEVAYGT